MDRKIQISAKEEPAEGQGILRSRSVCLNLYGFYTLARIAVLIRCYFQSLSLFHS